MIAHFDLVELDLLATYAGEPAPFPLRVPSFGRDAAERARELAGAGLTLSARGLADERGPRGVAAELVTALREHRCAVDLVVVDADTTTRVAALVYGTAALICVQGPADAVEVRRVIQTALVDELAAVVAEVPGAPTLPITLPPGVVAEALRLIEGFGDTDATRSLVRHLICDRGGDPEVLDRLTGLLKTVTSRGQLGATSRTGAVSTRAGTELSWLDTPSGRVRIDQDVDGWTSINPLRPNDFRLAASRAAWIAREPR